MLVELYERVVGDFVHSGVSEAILLFQIVNVCEVVISDSFYMIYLLRCILDNGCCSIVLAINSISKDRFLKIIKALLNEQYDLTSIGAMHIWLVSLKIPMVRQNRNTYTLIFLFAVFTYSHH